MANQVKQAFANIESKGAPAEYHLSTAPTAPELPERAGALPQRLQDLALAYIGARQRAGDSLLEMARWLSEARQEAVRGEWYVFLDATGTSANQAESLLAIHARAMSDPVFAAAMRRNFLSLSAGYELLSAPADVQDRLLQSEQPITRKQIREEKESAKPHAGVGYGTTQAPLPAMPAATPAAERESDLPAEYAIIQRRLAAHGITLLSNMQGRDRAFVTRKDGGTGVVTFTWQNVLDRLSLLEDGMEADPAHVAAVEEQIEAGDREPQLMPTLIELDANRMPDDLHRAGYYWHSATPPTIALNGSAWRGDAPTIEGAIESARMREKMRAPGTINWNAVAQLSYKLSREMKHYDTDRDTAMAITLELMQEMAGSQYVVVPPFPTKDLPTLMESMSFLLEMVAKWVPSSRAQAAPVLGMIKVIGRKSLEATDAPMRQPPADPLS